jgi:Kef-type K+ transport system membrane component KefB
MLGRNWLVFSQENKLKIGIMLNSRGVLDLIVADLAFEKGYISSTVFSILVVLGISTVIVNPILYKRLINSKFNPEDLSPEPVTE